MWLLYESAKPFRNLRKKISPDKIKLESMTNQVVVWKQNIRAVTVYRNVEMSLCHKSFTNS